MVQPVTSTAEQLKLDDTPLKFGKYRGSTPNEILENYGSDGASYIVWMFKKVENFPTCSPSLAKIAAGEQTIARGNREIDSKNTGYSERDVTPNNMPGVQPVFDDMDDDIPF